MLVHLAFQLSKVSICWFNKEFIFICETFTEINLGPQCGFDFLFMNIFYVSVKKTLQRFSPFYTFPIKEIFANDFKSCKDVECCFVVTLIGRAPHLHFVTYFGVHTSPRMPLLNKKW